MQKAGETKVRKASARSVVRLPPDLGIEHVRDLQAQLAARVADAKPVTLDAAQVSRVHAAALQLFCMFCRDRSRAGLVTQWRQPSDTLRSAAALLGMTQLIQLSRKPG